MTIIRLFTGYAPWTLVSTLNCLVSSMAGHLCWTYQ